ncbi:MAG: hypothetical protein JWO76_1972 [Nocardioides sp.]|nr:hypothetical protein [Nocardioides sp.]
MPRSADDSWASQDLPFLVELEAQLQLSPRTPISARDVGNALSWTDIDLIRSLHNLRRGGYIRDQGRPRRAGAGPLITPLDVTEKALYAVGRWPTPETALNRMITALEAIAENTDDEDTRTRARKVLNGLTGAGRAIGISVAAAAITGQIPGQ